MLFHTGLHCSSPAVWEVGQGEAGGEQQLSLSKINGPCWEMWASTTTDHITGFFFSVFFRLRDLKVLYVEMDKVKKGNLCPRFSRSKLTTHGFIKVCPQTYCKETINTTVGL